MRPTSLERAFELAESGRLATIAEISARLKREGYQGVDSLLAQGLVRRRLAAALDEARPALAGAVIEDASVDLGHLRSAVPAGA